jgi:16S rRNA (cytosine1402-N4)-methyltransferase
LPALDSGQLILVRSNFSHLTEVAAQHNWSPVSGIIFDLGVSWHQLSTATRGFSFKLSGPLDMRMDERLIPTAATLVNTLSVKQLTQILMEFGELNNGRILAQKIISARPITDTFQLAAVIGPPDSRKQRVFQALRIAVNSEIFSLQAGLSAALPVLSNRGRVLVISFHSLEDALVKNQFKNWSHDHLGHMLTHKPITPSPEEIRINPKSHSAKLRIFEKY